MFRMSKISDYGLRLVLTLSQRHLDGENYSARDLARITDLPRPVVSKALKMLAKEQILGSERGVNGGYRLLKGPEKISVGEVLRALEGPILIKGCLEADSDCANIEKCTVRFNWEKINRSIGNVLDSVSLANLMTPLSGDAFVQIEEKKQTEPAEGEFRYSISKVRQLRVDPR